MSEDTKKTMDNPENEQDEEETPVTMLDVLQDEESLEADAKAVLGNADDKNCTYFKGYMKRQALYACLTCLKEEKQAGICLACSYHCHEDHELVELYTKRNFRCDCGNANMNNDCKLETDKTATNEKNKYNQNFKGDYCTCQRPYPDPEDSVPDEMIQCILCEDWYHGRHLMKGENKIPKDENYSEMICFNCCNTFQSILSPYMGLSVTPLVATSDNSDDKVEVTDVQNESTASNVLDESTSSLQDERKCKKVVPAILTETKTLFLPTNWRQDLCKCDDCLKLYKEQQISFLIDEEDTVHHYESLAKNEGTQYEKGMEALSSMDRVKQMEAIQGYNSMKSNLMEYLKKFAENGKVVRQEDIQEFFQQMQANKRPRVEIPKFCK